MVMKGAESCVLCVDNIKSSRVAHKISVRTRNTNVSVVLEYCSTQFYRDSTWYLVLVDPKKKHI